MVSNQCCRFKCVVINDADLLSRQAQAGLRRTMEKYISTCRVILLSESFTKLIPPIRSRCLCIRVPAPSVTEVKSGGIYSLLLHFFLIRSVPC
jgi:replication factor C subunit 3/5